MWLAGFDVQSIANMYFYKPMSEHNLMQAIAHVNRVFRDKEGRLIVDYIVISTALKQAMNNYTVKNNYGRRCSDRYDTVRTLDRQCNGTLKPSNDITKKYKHHKFLVFYRRGSL